MDSMTTVNRQPAKYYARTAYSRTQKAGWVGEFTVSIDGDRAEVEAELTSFTHRVEAIMKAETDRLNAAESAG